MLFSSYVYVLAFLPTAIAGFFIVGRRFGSPEARTWLLACSLVFYGWWDYRFLPLLIGAAGANYLLGRRLAQAPSGALLTAGVCGNLALLGFFKYADFLIVNLNTASGAGLPLLGLILPLGISFHTFQNIAYLVDCNRERRCEASFQDYVLFLSFFPHAIAGPIVHHREMIPQFAVAARSGADWERISAGAFLFFIGLFKKVIVADNLSVWAADGFSQAAGLSFIEAWTAALAYTFQLYFDFSGYTDMAIGAAAMLNIRLPVNFLSPYKARNIQEFWRRWHITLSRFLREYVYIPLGGNAGGRSRTLVNLLLTFLIGGIWHGAGWNFAIWGLLHGVALVAHRLWSWGGLRMPAPVGWLLTFLFVVVAWVFFRSPDFTSAIQMLTAMAGANGVVLPLALERILPAIDGVSYSVYWLEKIQWETGKYAPFVLPACLAVVLAAPNSIELFERFRPSPRRGWWLAAMASLALCWLHREAEFLYYQF